MPEHTLRARPQYDIQKPPEGYQASILWVLGQDTKSRKIASQLSFQPRSDEIDLLTHVVSRNPSALGHINEIWGRTALIDTSPSRLLRTYYDAIEIGGFGYQHIDLNTIGTYGVRFNEQIEIPSASNFAESHRGVTRTIVIGPDGPAETGDNFSFTGAYTQKQAIHKIAVNLVVLSKIAHEKNIPFLSPIPIAFGYYPTVKDVYGAHAYFVAWKVPYKGKRTGTGIIDGGDIDSINAFFENIILSAPRIAPALRFLHDKLGLTHNQPHPSNYYIPTREEGKLPYLADFTTAFPISQRMNAMARAHDISEVVRNTWDNVRPTYPNANEANLINLLSGRAFEQYLGFSPPVAPAQMSLVHEYFKEIFEQLLHNDKLPRTFPSSWNEIQNMEAELQKFTVK